MTELQELLRLQNGSDVRGVAMETEGGPPVTLGLDVARRIAGGFARWLAGRAERRPLRIGLGHDPRLSAQALKAAVAGGLAVAGAEVLDCGLASTPAMFMGCIYPQCDFDGAVMITGSHLPANRNGLKFFTKDGGVEAADITEMLAMEALVAAEAGPAPQPCALMEHYAADLRQRIRDEANNGTHPLTGLHVVLDAGNGAGGFFASDVLEPLGARCEGLFLEPDGSFPNHVPNPENPEAMQALTKAVKDGGADLGLIFDTDVDRMAAVLPGGVPATRNATIALMGAIAARRWPGATVVTDSPTSDLLTEFLEGRLGLLHHRFKRGYRNVINEAKRLCALGTQAPLAIETSGHGALADNYFLDDGAHMAALLVAAAARAKKEDGTLAGLLEGYHAPVAEAERRVTIEGAGFAEYGGQVLEGFAARATLRGLHLAHSYEGVRINVPGKGWLLLRLSLHDPVLPLNAEGKSEETLREMLDLAAALLDGFERLDCAALKAKD